MIIYDLTATAILGKARAGLVWIEHAQESPDGGLALSLAELSPAGARQLAAQLMMLAEEAERQVDAMVTF